MAQDSQRVIWYEGMTLDPHHFQQWDRYQRRLLETRVRDMRPYSHGLTAVEINQERLANGELALQACSGVMPDGMAFDIPERDPTPAPRNVQDAFEATRERLLVFLALPAERAQGGNFLLQGADNRRETRYVAESVEVPDENTGADERRVEVGRPNFQLRFGGEPLEEYTTLPLAKVVRDAGGAFVLSDRFMPPCLRIGASDVLMQTARRLLELLVSKSDSLTERRRSASSQRELSPADVTALGLLSTVNTFIPLLHHHHAGASSHPEALYTTLLALAGQLSAHLPEASVQPRALPTYDHGNLGGCFRSLDEALRTMLGGARPASNHVQLDLEQQRENLYVASADSTLLSSGDFFIVARAPDRSEEELVAEIPRKLRIASLDTIDGVIRSYTRALPVEHTHRLPVGMPVDERASYFQLQKRGPFWDAIKDEQALALFVPSEFRDLEVKLVAVKREG